MRKKEILLVLFTLAIFICIQNPVKSMRALSPSICRVPEVNGICCEQYLGCYQFDWGACFGGMPVENFDCTCYYADINNDGKVNILDVTIAARAFGSSHKSQNWNPLADVNNDGSVNIIDISYIARVFGKSC